MPDTILTAIGRNSFYLVLPALIVLSSCNQSPAKREVALYETHCASCHKAPDIGELPAEIWANAILPEMGARLGVREEGYNPYAGLSMDEHYRAIQTGVYPSRPLINTEDWQMLKQYILEQAPDSLPSVTQEAEYEPVTRFKSTTMALDSVEGSMISFMKLQPGKGSLIYGEVSGKLSEYYFEDREVSPLGRFGRAITSYSVSDSVAWLSSAGYLDPSEITSGRIYRMEGDSITMLPDALHRPVHTTVHDFNGDGTREVVVSEFGDLKGALSMFVKGGDGKYRKKVLLERPGTIRTKVNDMNDDGKDDLLVLTSQGDEGITIMYQTAPLEFEAEQVLRFSPVYGTSWFDLMDYDADGDLDIVTVHGDNADKSYEEKPYHGMRIHINEGAAGFRETFFYPFNGATRVVASDFDQDGDTDFALLSTFPDYSEQPVLSFAYLENANKKTYDFNSYSLGRQPKGNWFLMDSADIDNDGDEDIVLSSFTYYFTPVPAILKAKWDRSFTDILILENTLKKGDV